MIYIVENYPMGWLRAEQIDEEECIEKYLNGKYPYHNPIYILGFDLFYQYMQCLNDHNNYEITKNGYIIRYWNNSSWIVVEARNNFDSVQKAQRILHDRYNR